MLLGPDSFQRDLYHGGHQPPVESASSGLRGLGGGSHAVAAGAFFRDTGLAGGSSILFGYKAKAGAWLVVAFLVPVTLMMHNFWVVTDPQMRMMQMVNFNKNLAMLGGAFMIAYFGSGPYSVENFWPLEGKAARTHDVPLRKAA